MEKILIELVEFAIVKFRNGEASFNLNIAKNRIKIDYGDNKNRFKFERKMPLYLDDGDSI